MKSLKSRRVLSNAVIYVILAIMTVIWVSPIVWLIFQSFGATTGTKTQFIPAFSTLTFDNYLKLFCDVTGVYPTKPNGQIIGDLNGNFPLWFLNTLIVAVSTCIISTLFVLGTAYGLSRFKFKGRELFMKINLVIGMFPGFLGMIIMYWVMKEIFHLQGYYASLIIIYSVGAGGGYYISKGYFDTISKSIDEAAMIDGANKAQIFFQIILPLAKPIVIYTILTSFMAPWGEYITSSYIIGTANNPQWTVGIGLYQMLNSNDRAQIYYNCFAAGSICVAIPIVSLFFLLQKYYVSGVTGGAVKG